MCSLERRGLLSEIDVFLKKSFSLLMGIDQTNCVYSDNYKDGSAKIVNFMTPGAGVLVLG